MVGKEKGIKGRLHVACCAEEEDAGLWGCHRGENADFWEEEGVEKGDSRKEGRWSFEVIRELSVDERA